MAIAAVVARANAIRPPPPFSGPGALTLANAEVVRARDSETQLKAEIAGLLALVQGKNTVIEDLREQNWKLKRRKVFSETRSLVGGEVADGSQTLSVSQLVEGESQLRGDIWELRANR